MTFTKDRADDVLPALCGLAGAPRRRSSLMAISAGQPGLASLSLEADRRCDGLNHRVPKVECLENASPFVWCLLCELVFTLPRLGIPSAAMARTLFACLGRRSSSPTPRTSSSSMWTRRSLRPLPGLTRTPSGRTLRIGPGVTLFTSTTATSPTGKIRIDDWGARRFRCPWIDEHSAAFPVSVKKNWEWSPNHSTELCPSALDLSFDYLFFLEVESAGGPCSRSVERRIVDCSSVPPPGPERLVRREASHPEDTSREESLWIRGRWMARRLLSLRSKESRARQSGIRVTVRLTRETSL